MTVLTKVVGVHLLMFVCAGHTRASNPPPLGQYGADSTMVSVSGVSSGADMAVQLHVAYSASIMGVGAVAGAPYYCAKGYAPYATVGRCSAFGSSDDIDLQDLFDETADFVASGKVDATYNMASDRVYLFHGTEDIVVPHGVALKLQDYYEHYINSSNIKTVYDMGAGHAFITKFKEPSGGVVKTCEKNELPFINYCNYTMAYDILNHIYGNLQEPSATTALAGELLSFDQSEFLPSTWTGMFALFYKAMSSQGKIYVPSWCMDHSGCKVHVALHGCSQASYALNYYWDKYYTCTGYSEVGELNNIIILYPQTVPNVYLSNLLACWDWWGFTGTDYANKDGKEMTAIKDMIDRLLENRPN